MSSFLANKPSSDTNLKIQTKQLNCPRCSSYNFHKNGKYGSGKQRYKCRDCKKIFTENPAFLTSSLVLPKDITATEMFSWDTWDLRILGLKKSVANGQYTLNFSSIQPEWLKLAAKQWMKYRVTIDAASTLRSKLRSVKIFSTFIESEYFIFQATDINREFIVEYLTYLNQKDYTAGTRIGYISNINQFIEECQRFDWLDITKEKLIFEDYPKKDKKLPRFIPEEILKQLDDNLNALPKTVKCMVQVLRETGLRISELCNIPFDCLKQDSTGDYWLDVYQIKMKKEIPPLLVSKYIAELIHDQQKYIVTSLGSNFPYLFCETEYRSSFSTNPETKRSEYIKEKPLNYFQPITQKLHSETLRGYLHKLAREKKIKDATGIIFPLGKCHQFRHTHGTELINNEVPQHIVQKRLGHASPEMTSVYAHIHDKTMKKEMEKFWDGKIFNNQGQVVVSENPDLDTAGMQWIKRNMKAQTLPDGFCGLPVTQNCPVQGSPCLTCSHLRTTVEFLDVHKKRLEETEKLIENARANGWDRQVETNLPIAENLRKIIRGLEQKEVIHGDEKFPEQEGGKRNA